MTAGSNDPRAELASIAASLRAYLELQRESGATGIPRGKRRTQGGATTGNATANVAAASTPTSSSNTTLTANTTTNAAASPNTTQASTPARTPPAAPPRLKPPSSPAEARTYLSVLAQEVTGCTRCALAQTRTQTVFARGNPEASLCFVGEAPGADEDAQGLPFVGRAGQLLDKMIGAMGLSPEKDVYICNIIKCRPPGNRRPTPEETSACIPYLHTQLEVVKPRVIVALGNTAVGALLETNIGITKLRGQWKLYRGSTLLMPTYHPSYLIRPGPQQAEAKRQAWEDLQLVMKELGIARPKPRA